MSYFEEFASVYDAFTKDVDYDAEADYVVSLMQSHGVSGKTVLDLACGTGSLTEAFLERGFDVIGADLSENMLMLAREKCAPFGGRALLLHQDMRELDLFGTVDCAVCALDSVNHLNSVEDVTKTFERVFLFLEPGGVFAFDVNTPYKHAEVLGENTFVFENETSFLVWQNTQAGGGTVDMFIDVFTLCADGNYSRSSEEFSETAYSEAQLRDILKHVGFENIEVRGENGEISISPTEQRLRFCSVKPMSYKEKMQNG